MGKGGCVDGQLITTLYSSPVPSIGLYIAAGTLVCLFCMTFDMVYGLTRSKPFLPCKLFPMSAFNMTVLAVATKIPFDLTSPMPRASNQLSKLTATALMCTSIGFYMPSLGTMRTSERYGNLAALSIMVITVVVNVGIQLGTGVIFEFMVEHIIIMVCILVLLVLMWSSALAFSGHYSFHRERGVLGEGLWGLRFQLIGIIHNSHENNPQTLLCRTTHHNAFAILCTVSSILVLQAIPRWLFIAPKNMKLQCSGASDYKWSIPIVIVIQFLTIAVGTFSIIYRWFSFMWYDGAEALVDSAPPHPEKELVDLKEEPIVLTFVNKSLSIVLIATKEKIMDAIIWTQKKLYAFTEHFFGFPLYVVAKFLGVRLSRWHSLWDDIKRWTDALKKDQPAQEDLIELISEWRAGSPSTAAFAFEIDCCHFVNKFEAIARDYDGV